MVSNESTSSATLGGAISERAKAFDAETPNPIDVMKHRALRHPGFLIGLTIILIACCSAIFAPLLAPFDPYEQEISRRLINPVWGDGGTWIHVLGTDQYGRDYLSRLIWGAQVSMLIGTLAASTAACIGTVIGMIGGYFGGRVDAVVMYLINCKLALPGLLIALSLVSIFGGSVIVLVLVLAFLFWDRYAIVTRTVTMQIRNQEFVTAAEAVGASRARIIFTEIFPNIVNQVIVIFTLEVAVAILIEATLSFLGLGVPPPTPSWGQMVAEGRSFMFFQPFLVMIPGLTIFIVSIGINMFGDGVRDITSPEGRN